MNIDRLLKHACKQRGITLDDNSYKDIKKNILKEEVHLANVLPIINKQLDTLVESYTEQQKTIYTKVFNSENDDSHKTKCPVCKNGVMTSCTLANDRDVEYCKKCKVVMPYNEEK